MRKNQKLTATKIHDLNRNWDWKGMQPDACEYHEYNLEKLLDKRITFSKMPAKYSEIFWNAVIYRININ